MSFIGMNGFFEANDKNFDTDLIRKVDLKICETSKI